MVKLWQGGDSVRRGSNDNVGCMCAIVLVMLFVVEIFDLLTYLLPVLVIAAVAVLIVRLCVVASDRKRAKQEIKRKEEEARQSEQEQLRCIEAESSVTNKDEGGHGLIHNDVKEEPDKSEATDGHAFKNYVAQILRDNELENVWVTQGSEDYGADIIADAEDGKCAFRCKCYFDTHDLEVIKEVNAAREHYKCKHAIVISDSYFSKNACELAKKWV